MKALPLLGLAGFAALGAHAQQPPLVLARTLDPVVVTASRGLEPSTTLRDATVITRAQLDALGTLSLGEALQRLAGVELRATGGPGQPQGLFIRGAGAAHTLVLVDGLRIGSATVGTTAIEHIPVELIERIEVVKGPMSSLYGSDAIGGVVQVFTRGKPVPHLFASAAYGTDRDRRAAAGITTVDGDTSAVLSLGWREVDAPSATTQRAPFCHDPDRDPHENAFANLRVGQRLWQGENLVLEAFGSRSRTAFDGCGTGDRNDQTLAGARLTSSAQFAPDWASRLSVGTSLDRLEIRGAFPNRFETRQDQASWVNEFTSRGTKLIAGVEALRQEVVSDPAQVVFSVDQRETWSGFAGITESWGVHRLEGSWRRDDDDAFGQRDTGSVGYGFHWASVGFFSATVGRGFRAPTFFDLYGPASDFYQPNPLLAPEHSRSTEISFRAEPTQRLRWKVTAFDNRIEDLIAFVAPTVQNVDRARIRGAELAASGEAWGVAWSAQVTVQRPRDEDTGRRLAGRAERFASLHASRRFGPWTAGLTLHGSGERFDTADESAASRIAGYAVVDARLRYAAQKHWSVELAATNLADRRYENSVGYEGTRRGVMLTVRFDAF